MKEVRLVFVLHSQNVEVCTLIDIFRNIQYLKSTICVTNKCRYRLKQIFNKVIIKFNYVLSIVKEWKSLFNVIFYIPIEIKTNPKKQRFNVVLTNSNNFYNDNFKILFGKECNQKNLFAALTPYEDIVTCIILQKVLMKVFVK